MPKPPSFLLIFVVLASTESGPALGSECAYFSDAVVRTPSAEWIMETADEHPVAIVSLDPRGVGNLQILEELDFVWIDAEDDSAAWHHRDRHDWRGAGEVDRCSPRYRAEAVFNADYIDDGIAWIDSKSANFWARQFFIFPEEVKSDFVHYDVVIEIGNESGSDLEGYLRSFSCPTPAGPIDASNSSEQLIWEDGEALAPWTAEGGGSLGWIVHPEVGLENSESPLLSRSEGVPVRRWNRPVLVSGCSPGGWRSILLFAHDTAAAIGDDGDSGMRYLLFPGAETFRQGASFVAHIRHCLIRSEEIPTSDFIRELYTRFESEWEELDSMLMTFVD